MREVYRNHLTSMCTEKHSVPRLNNGSANTHVIWKPTRCIIVSPLRTHRLWPFDTMLKNGFGEVEGTNNRGSAPSGVETFRCCVSYNLPDLQRYRYISTVKSGSLGEYKGEKSWLTETQVTRFQIRTVWSSEAEAIGRECDRCYPTGMAIEHSGSYHRARVPDLQ